MSRIQVLVVDDSATVRQVLSMVLAQQADIDVIGTASDPLFAMEKMARQWPDVILLDIEMPRMDGLTFLRKLMAERPTPVIICSSLTARGAETTMQALAAGAVSVIAKPTVELRQFLESAASEITEAVRGAARANVSRMLPFSAGGRGGDVRALVDKGASSTAQSTEKVVALGASTGGTQALEAVLTRLTPSCPGIVIVQHMPEKFTAAFAARLDTRCAITVCEARDGDPVVPGQALVAPGGRHMMLRRSGGKLQVEVVAGPRVNRHCPSVDVLFRSVARSVGRNAMGVIMTGMGDDGARGLKELRDAGGRTFAQDEASCVVYGMPREAVKLGAVERSVTLSVAAAEISRYGLS
ncbi:protein-glutamate methylesterase/protein-glutamine glutaminase [Aerolutibacter ruishenii]|uniref:Protein-glutamate methylesterase/protein-glutamine glutaminase n=1 Tax=Aerolutibacter ruishenii TaxID=686800 RepID=A0A562LK27_9GAMM|nr:chemotaxis response regulator protein-glutamate methylesterase [Lysobacter ruishenii]TWI07990.1 two-component system chemotaxis response regulator CheB [Lysobacter ruishenii]